MRTHLVQPNSHGKIKLLTLELEGNEITKTWGIMEGKTQTKTSAYKAKNVGKKNEISAEDAAINEMNKIIKTKIKEGYKETDSLDNIPVFEDPFDFDLDNIPKSFCCSKPTQTITEPDLNKLISSGSAKIYVKYNGGCHYIHINSMGEVQIYTRRWDNHTDKYPHIVKAVSEQLPVNTLMIVELCIDPLLGIDHMKAFKLLSEISKTDTLNGECKPSQEASWALQKQYPVRAAVFGFMYYNGEQVWQYPYGKQMPIIENRISPLSTGHVLFKPQKVGGITNATELLGMAKTHKKGLEGFIIWDTTKAMEVTMNGKPKRRAAWKVKIKGEMDVIAIGGVENKVPGKFGSITIGRYAPNGKWVDMGTVGGLKDKEKDPAYWPFPCVVEVIYDNIFPDTGLLQFGNFSKIHLDKTIDEVDLFSIG